MVPFETPYERQLKEAERRIIIFALEATRNIPFAAAALGVADDFLMQRINALNIEVVEVEDEPAPPRTAPVADVMCTECGATATTAQALVHRTGCSDVPNAPAPEPAYIPPPLPPPQASPFVGLAAPLTPPQPLPQRQRPDVNATPDVEPAVPQRRKRRNNPPTEKQIKAWQQSAARARAGKLAKKAAKEGADDPSASSAPSPMPAAPAALPASVNVLPFQSNESVDEAVARIKANDYPDEDEAIEAESNESELAYCRCSEVGPAKCPIHRDGGGRAIDD